MSVGTAVALVLALVSTTLINLAYLQEHDAAAELPVLSMRRPLHSAGLLRERSWLIGFAMESVGFLLYAAALALAELALVQSIAAGGIGVLDTYGLRQEVLGAERPPTLAVGSVVHEVDLRAERISSIVWATRYRRPYPWLPMPVLDRFGEIRQHRGHTPVPGLYVLGQRFQYRRNSNFIGGVGRDAACVVEQITGRHDTTGSPVCTRH